VSSSSGEREPGPDSLRLAGRVAVVTGAARGIGLAISKAFARCGAQLAVCDRDAEALAAAERELALLGAAPLAVALDVRDAARVRELAARVSGERGPIDVWVNNAGGTFAAHFAEVTERGEAALIAANYSSVSNGVRALLPVASPRGASIINVTSVEAHRAAPGYAVYAAMKAAVENLTRSLALELAARRIRVNCIAPDAIPTPGTGGLAPPTPWPESGHPDDVAGAALYLASDLSRFVTGSTLHVDGGTSAAGGWRRQADGSFGLA
jgi:NAD(P)-dependent dehydrogenase (short-subunit alcohol dehydrogenase family)